MRGANPQIPDWSVAVAPAGEAELYEGTPFTAHELLRWADLVLERLGLEPGGLVAVRVEGFEQRPALDALRLMCEHRRAELAVLVAGAIGRERLGELRRRGALFATLYTPSGEDEPASEDGLSRLRLSAALGEPQVLGELFEWPGERMAMLAYPDAPPAQALRRYALDLLAALERP